MVHIKLVTIKMQLQAKMHYPTKHMHEDDGLLTLDEAFDALLYGFQQYLNRNRLGGGSVVGAAKARSFFTERYADMFTDYCIKGWRVV